MITSQRILIVEDEKAILDVYKDILNAQAKTETIRTSRSLDKNKKDTGGPTDQFELTLVSTGEDAVTAVKASIKENRPFAVGFFDVLLGTGIDGIETVKQIHSLDPDMYAVLVTAYQDRHVDAIRNVFGKEFQDKWDYLNKPFSEGEILQKARNMVSMWNIRKREREQQARLDELKSKLVESEKSLTIAAVARSVGHEFGNILLQIMGRADLARNGDNATMNKALETILLATEHASKVLERFKNLSKSNESHQLHPMSIAEPINEVVLLVDHELKRRKIAISVSLGQLPQIQGSHSTLVQVFMNLIINAMHAMKENGKIEIKGQHNDKKDDENIEVTIRDTGPGIPQDILEKIFEPFFTTKGDSGTGLGLSICKEIIEITHGGRISASNHPEGGAVFVIQIPIRLE